MKKVMLLLAVASWPAPLWADAPALARLEIQPGPRIVFAPTKTQQLAVIAHFNDGSSRDVTRLTVFSSSDSELATVNDKGLVEFHGIGEAAILCRYLTTTQPIRLAHVDPKPGYRWPDPPEVNYVDRHVFNQLKRLSIPPSDLCTDAEFMRRAYLDTCATLPTPTEVRKFLADPDKDKRAKLIDRLLDQPEYAEFWTLHWTQSLGVEARRLGEKNARAYRAWIRDHVGKNTPIDRMVRELLTAQGDSQVNPAVNYFRPDRKPTELAEATASLFLGIRLECAACHDHFTARWTQDNYHAFTAFFPQVVRRPSKSKESEIVALELKAEWLHPTTRQIVPARALGGPTFRFKLGDDRRAALAAWMTAPDNPYFARAFVNRVWSKLLGRGIVEPIYDFRASNPSANDALLNALAQDFVAHRFDMKALIRNIMNSRTYQLSAKANEHNGADQKYFSRRVTTLLYQEQVFDAITAFTEVPQSFAGMPIGTRAVQVLDEFPIWLGPSRSHREMPCECEPERPNLAGVLHLLNSEDLLKRLGSDKSRVARLLKMKLSDKEIAEELFLAAVSRLPTEKDVAVVQNHLWEAKDRRRAWEDVAWALINSREFIRRN